MNYMSIKNATESSADLYFYGDIVGSEWEKWENEDTCPADVINFLDQVKDVQQLNIYVNSGGGSVFAGLAIYNMLKRHKAHKTVYIDGLAASIASVIALAGDKIVIPSNAFMMIHKPWSWTAGNATDLRKMADDLDRIEQGILNVYAENLRDSAHMDAIKEMVNAETWLVGADAAQYFNIELSEPTQAVAMLGDSAKNYRNGVPKQIVNAVKERKESEAEAQRAQAAAEIEAMKLQLELLSA